MEASGHFRSILARVCWRVRVMRSPGSETGTERGGRRVAIHAQFATFPDISSGVVSRFQVRLGSYADSVFLGKIR